MGFDRTKEVLEWCSSLMNFRPHLSRLMIDDSFIL